MTCLMINKDHMISANTNIVASYQSCPYLNRQGKGRRAVKRHDIMPGEGEGRGVFRKKTRRLRLWRLCLQCNKDTRSGRGIIREKNSEYMDQRKEQDGKNGGKSWQQGSELAGTNVIRKNQYSWHSSVKTVWLNEIVVRFYSFIQETFTKHFL